MGDARGAEGQDGSDRRFNGPRFQHPRDGGQALGRDVDEKERRSDAALRREALIGRRDRGNERATPLQYPERSRLHVTADEIDNRIEIVRDILERLAFTVEHLIGTGVSDIGRVRFRARRDDADTASRAQAARERADIARGAMDPC